MKTKEELHSNLVKWIRSYQFEHNSSDAQMAALLDISKNQYKKLINGYTKHVDVYLISRIYHMTGTMCFEVLMDPDPDLQMIPQYLSLNPASKRLIDACIRYESNFSDSGPDMVRVYIPTQQTSDGMIWDGFITELLPADRSAYGGQIDVGLKLNNNDLAPVYFKDDILWVCYRNIRPGEIGIFVHNPSRMGYIRKFTVGFDDGREYRDLVPLDHCPGRTFRVYCDDQKEISDWIKYGVVISRARI